MKHFKLYALTIAVVMFFVISAVVSAQEKNIEKFKKIGKLFDPKTIETLKGQITSVKKHYYKKGLSYVFGFKLKTDDETIYVHAGPSWYIEEKEFTFSAYDSVEVTGSRVTINDTDVIIAAEIIKDKKTLILRNAEGTPLWIGWGDK